MPTSSTSPTTSRVFSQGDVPAQHPELAASSRPLTVALSLFLGVTAAYALARVRFRGRTLLLFTILAVSMFPQIAVLAGLFELVRLFGLYNTPWALILSYLIFTLPFTVWVLTTFMRELPIEIEEAAIVDGATPWLILTRVFLPLMWPALVTTGLLAFIVAWNEFLFALTFTSSNDDAHRAGGDRADLRARRQYETPWGHIMAASVIVTVPLIVLVLVLQRKIVSGLTAGGVKGEGSTIMAEVTLTVSKNASARSTSSRTSTFRSRTASSASSSARPAAGSRRCCG